MVAAVSNAADSGAGPYDRARMKNLLILGVVAVVLVGGLSLYALRLFKEVEQQRAEVEAEHQASVAALRALDDRFPFEAKGPALDPARFTTWLDVRIRTARTLDERLQEATGQESSLHGRRTVVAVLDSLASELEEKRMGLKEYLFISRRWQALLARGEHRELTAAWDREVRTFKDGKVLPLPDPAKDATEKERELLTRYTRPLQESLHADLLVAKLESIEAGES